MLMGTVTGAAAAQQEDAEGPANRAHIDVGATSDMLDTATSISAELFTFSHTDLEAHRERYAELTTGELADGYDKLFDQVADVATEQQLSMRSEVTDAAVRLLTKDRAEVLVYLTQDSTRADTGRATQRKAMFLATFTKVDGDWKAAELDTFEER